MKSGKILALLSAAVLTGMLITGVQAQVTDTNPVEDANAATIFGGFGYSSGSCPGGGAAVCVVCGADNKCVKACVGDYTCIVGKDYCAHLVNACQTVDPTVSWSLTFRR